MNDMQDKIKSTLLGLAWGDILGVPIESWSEEQIREVYHIYLNLPEKYNLNKLKNIDKKVRRLRPLGIHSDDTQQSMALINVCLSEKGWKVDKFANLLVKGMEKGAWRGIGSRFEEAVNNLQNNINPYESGSFSAGIGSAMRVAPLGALYYNDLHLLRKIIIESSMVTHREITAIALSYAISYIVGQYIAGRTTQYIINKLPQEIYGLELELINNKELKINTELTHAFSNGLELMLTKTIQDIDEMRKQLLLYAKNYLGEQYKENVHPNDPFTLLGGLHSVLMGLQDEYRPTETLISIMNLGSDTDTVGAITGAILGAKYGSEWIPTNKFLDNKRIIGYAKSMVTLKPFETEEELLNNESQLTIKENEHIETILNYE